MTKIKQAVELLEEALEYGKESCVVQALELLKSTEQPDEEGWITWNGGKCPVEFGTRVDVKHRNGRFHYNQRALFCNDIDYAAEDWSHTGRMYDIIAYRLHRD